MNIARGGRFVFIAQWVLAVLLPVWVAVGRELLGVDFGWLGLSILLVAPIAVLALLVPPVLSLFDREVRAAKAVRRGYAIATTALWAAFFLLAFTIPDVGDDREYPSAIMEWFGASETVSRAIGVVLVVVICAAYAAAFALAVAGIVRARRAATR